MERVRANAFAYFQAVELLAKKVVFNPFRWGFAVQK